MDAATGTNLWATPIDNEPWDPSSDCYGGEGTAPYYTGDGPRTTPSVNAGQVFALSGLTAPGLPERDQRGGRSGAMTWFRPMAPRPFLGKRGLPVPGQ